ncbi:DUF3667 domain-containing protein [Flavobacterium sp.]
MAKEPVRLEKTCQNCYHEVQGRFCPSCGQENIETRKSFRHLFRHFLEDLTHYDNSFWRTIFTLLFKPAALSSAYVAGRRLYYLNPFRLYFFISFITFLVLTLFIDNSVASSPTDKTVHKEQTSVPSIDSLHIKEKGIDGLTKIGVFTQDNNDSLKKILKDTIEINTKELINIGLENKNELDSLQKKGSKEVAASSTKYWFIKKWLAVEEKHTGREIVADFSMAFRTNFPKVLFMYLPVFAFILWLFHDKKRWLYFDHGIFTLHYFSFLLLMTLVLFGWNKLEPISTTAPVFGWIHFSFKIIGYIFMLYYFFPAHRRFYGDKLFLSFFKSSLVYLINLLVFSAIMVLFSLYTYLNLN